MGVLGELRGWKGVAAGIIMLGVVTGGAVPALAQDGPPPVFTATTLDRALQQNHSSGKVLIAQFTATWCGPCRMMERSVWRDAAVEQWIKQNATAVLIDIDQDKQAAKTYGVQAVPQTIVFRSGRIVERTSGSMSAESMLNILRRGAGQSAATTSTPTAQPQTPAAPTRVPVNSAESLRRGRESLRSGQDEPAANNLAAAWRGSSAADRASIELDLRTLSGRSDAARRAIARERDEAQLVASGTGRTYDDLDEWLTLCDVLDERAAVVRWYASLGGEDATVKRLAFRLGTLLIAGGRGSDGSRLITDINAWSSWRHATLVGGDAAQRKAGLTRFREDVGRLYGSLQSSGRSGEAMTLAARALALDDTAWMRIVLVRRAADGGFASRDHSRWIAEAERMGANVKDLKDRVVAAVGN